MAASRLDHLVVTAPTLEAATAHVESLLGVEMAPGGSHVRMGTHNRLLRLGETCYLEAIAIEPGAPAAIRPRWFGLDALPARAPARLTTWAAATADLGRVLMDLQPSPGTVHAMARGDWQWRITVPADGQPPLAGCAPALIEWHDAHHPAQALPDRGCTLLRLSLVHPDPERVERYLAGIGFQGEVEVVLARHDEAPHLTALIRTPRGVRKLG